MQETHSFSFSFHFYILSMVSPPSIPSWKADSTVHFNPQNSSTCFSDLHLTCNIPSSGISDSWNKETKTSQRYAQTLFYQKRKRCTSLIWIMVMSEGFLLETPQKSCLLSPLEHYLPIDGFLILREVTLPSFPFTIKFFIHLSVALLLISTLLVPAFLSDRAFCR